MDVWRHIDRDRFHFTFCSLSGKPGVFESEIISLGGRIILCPICQGYRTFAKRFTEILDEIRYAVVHSHMLFFSGLTLRLAARKGVPIRIAHAHTTQQDGERHIRRRLYTWAMRHSIRNYATRGIGCSAQAADFLFTPSWRTQTAYDVIPCGINPARFQTVVTRSKLCESLGIPPAARIIGHVGSFRPQKNHAFLLRVVASLIAEDPRTHAVLVGDGHLRGEIEELARHLGILEHLTFTGIRDDVAILMRNLFDLVVFPSRYEGLGIVVIESQCAGVPCLVSDVIPKSVTLIEQLVHRESLQAGHEAWARRALEILDRPAYDKNCALRQVEASQFNISAGVRFLSELYAGQKPSKLGFEP